jgi:polysaccharide export outer membrane protein
VPEYTVSADDLLDIYVMDVPEVSRTYRVSSNGFLTLPLLARPIPAAGLTMDQLSVLIATKFREAGMLNNAQVTVGLKETRQHTVIVSGAVKNPKGYPIYGPTDLFELLNEAGGPTDDAGDEAIVARGEEGLRSGTKEGNQAVKADPASEGNQAVKADPASQEQYFTVDLRQLLQTGATKANVLLYPGDRVIVKRAALVYVLGAVNRPGGYVVNPNREFYTVVKAVALAGGLSPTARDKKISIFRRDPSAPEGKRQEISVNFKAIVTGEKTDIKLLADDIVYIPESTFKKGTHTAAATALAAGATIGTGLMIYRP